MINNLFSSSIYYSPIRPVKMAKKSFKSNDLVDLNKALIRDSQAILRTDLEGRKWSLENYPNGFTSYGSMDKLHEFSPYFHDLRLLLDQHVDRYQKHLEMDLGKGQLSMSSCWVNIMGKGAQHSMHFHPLSVISGTYYLSLPKDPSPIKFEDPRSNLFMASPPRKLNARISNQRFFSIRPKESHVVLFESWMRHEVQPCQSQKQRISISFNYDWN